MWKVHSYLFLALVDELDTRYRDVKHKVGKKKRKVQREDKKQEVEKKKRKVQMEDKVL